MKSPLTAVASIVSIAHLSAYPLAELEFAKQANATLSYVLLETARANALDQGAYQPTPWEGYVLSLYASQLRREWLYVRAGLALPAAICGPGAGGLLHETPYNHGTGGACHAGFLCHQRQEDDCGEDECLQPDGRPKAGGKIAKALGIDAAELG